MALSRPTEPPSSLAFPSPQTFDILPALHEILARVEQSLQQPQHSSLLPTDEQNLEDTDIGAAYAEIQPLEPKDLPTEVLQVKAKIRKALKELERLPDMERSVEEQEQEIEELQERIRRQREMVAKLGSLAKGAHERVG